MASALTGMDSLPSKDIALFKSTLKFYEYRQYKKGLKVCEQLLKKHPEHGESMAMKGLFLSHLSRKEEGYEYVRQGLKRCLKSHVCWHVYGLLYRADRNYDEAAKCFRNALRFDKDNMQILRELAVLQLQMRHYGPLVDTRYQLLVLRPMVKINWISLAVAYHLDNDYKQAIGVLDALIEGFPVENSSRAQLLEQGEILFYRIMILREAGMLTEALEALDEKSRVMSLDKLRVLEERAEVLFDLKEYKKASEIWLKLFDFNPDSNSAFNGHVKCVQAECSTVSILSVIDEFRVKYPESLLLKMEYIRIAKGGDDDLLLGYLQEQILPMIKRGILGSLSMIRDLYRKDETERTLNLFAESLKKELLDGVNDDNSRAWLHVCLAQHYSLVPNVTGSAKLAISHIEQAAELREGVPEIFLYYAKILKHLGCIDKAADCMEVARHLDLSDRFLNTKTAKYFLRAGRIEAAKDLAILFVKKGEYESQLQDLVEMQVLWFARELGRAYQVKGDHLKALEYFDQILKHFDDFYEDQFDFHNYVLRRMTLKSYVRLLRYEDIISGHPQLLKTAELAIKSLLHLFDDPNISLVDHLKTLSVDNPNQQDQPRDYLTKADRWVSRITSSRCNDWRAHGLAYQIYKRQGRILKASQSLFKVLENGVIPESAASFIDGLIGNEPEIVAARDLLKPLLNNASLKALQKPTMNTNSTSSPLEFPVLDKLLNA